MNIVIINSTYVNFTYEDFNLKSTGVERNTIEYLVE